MYFFIQTENFNRCALQFTLDKLNGNSQKSGVDINIDSIQGNILHGLILKNGSIKISDENLFSFSEIDLKYDLWGLLEQEIRLHNIVINSPEINISKIKDCNDSTVWNFSKLFTPSREQDTSQSEFDWGVDVENLKIENGSLKVNGQLSSEMPVWRQLNQKMKEFDFNNFEVKDLALELNGKFFPDNKNVTIRNLSFNSNSDFNVRKLTMSLGFDFSDTSSEMRNFELLTDKSDIKIYKLIVSGLNPLKSTTYENIANIKDKNIETEIDIRQFNFADLRFFVPSVNMLDSIIGLTLNVNGKYGDLNINRLNLRLPNSQINLTGSLKNLHDPENLYMDVHVKESGIFPKDVNTIVTISSIPDYSHIGTIYPDIIYKGTYSKFYTKLKINTSAGNVSGHFNIDIPAQEYNGRLITESLNPGKILKDNSLNGNLNFTADFSGHSFNSNSISANVKYQMGYSNIAGYNVRNSGGNIGLNGRSVSLNIRHNSSIGNAFVKGSVNFSSLKNPVYRLSGNVSNLNVGSFTKSQDNKSDLNFSFDISGRGITPDNLNGQYNFSINPSVYGSTDIPQTKMELNVKNSESENLIDIVSDIADFKAEGKFKIQDIVNLVRHNVEVASEKLSEKLKFDSIKIAKTQLIKINDFVLNYNLSVKDSAKAIKLLSPYNIKFNGSAFGHLESNQENFSMNSIINSPVFAFKDTVIVLNNFSSNVFFSNDYFKSSGVNTLEQFQFNLGTRIEKAVIENLSLDSVNVYFNIDNSSAALSAKVNDSDFSANLNGLFNLSSDSIVCTIDTLSITHDRYSVRNWGNWIFNYIPNESIKIQQMKLGSNNAYINIYGNYSLNSSSDIRIDGNDMRVRDLIGVFYSFDTSRAVKLKEYPFEGLLKQLSVNYKGTPSDPELNLIVNSSELKYEGKTFGKFNIYSGYKDEIALLDINLINEGKKGNLTIKGNLPIENPFRSESTETEFAKKQVSLRVIADDFEYQYFLKLIPGLPSLSGVMNGELSSEGIASSPGLKGAMNIKGGDLSFDLTGMDYSYDLSASAENSKLVIKTFKLYNADDKSRHIDINGKIDLAGMKLNDIDLNCTGDMIILDNDVDWNELELYGNILAGTGIPEISIKGNLDKLKISGQLLVKDATISSIPVGRKGYDNRKDNFKYIQTKQDSGFVISDTLIFIPENEYYTIDPFMKSKYIIDKRKNAVPGFLDIDVDIKTVKNIKADMDFGSMIAKLKGEMAANLRLKTSNGEFTATGNADVTGNSYFKFYKDFKLNDSKVIFDGKLNDPLISLQAIHTGTKVSEQYGNSASTEVQVKITVSGRASDPKVKLELIENGTTMTGPNVQADAVSYLLYGKFKSELNESERTSVAAAVGAAYVSSYVLDVLGGIFPLFSQATFTVGDKPLKELKNFEFSVDYPLNNVLNLNFPEMLMMQFFREELDDNFSTSQSTMNSGMKIVYKIKF